ncbi:MAG: hypothetical protein KF832_12550 [Caldilineaceae bacterium]|nr:hypothetical protein [Caldilineaceae bacterium]
MQRAPTAFIDKRFLCITQDLEPQCWSPTKSVDEMVSEPLGDCTITGIIPVVADGLWGQLMDTTPAGLANGSASGGLQRIATSPTGATAAAPI